MPVWHQVPEDGLAKLAVVGTTWSGPCGLRVEVALVDFIHRGVEVAFKDLWQLEEALFHTAAGVAFMDTGTSREQCDLAVCTQQWENGQVHIALLALVCCDRCVVVVLFEKFC